MILDEFESLLKETMGLDAASVGSSTIQRAVRSRQAACEAESSEAYLARVRSSETELRELIEAVIVPETWFFRDPEAFAALGKMAVEQWLATHAKGTMRLFSAPCSTGEEPYTMAMALLDAGMPVDRFQIDAVDISAQSLARAHRAVYGRNSFRGKNLGYRDRYFDSKESGYQVIQEIRRHTHFEQMNLLDGNPGAGGKLYDVVFCRNLLIYFDRPTQDRVVKTLGQLLGKGGLFFVGAAETGLMINHGYVSVKLPMSFAFRKAGAVPPGNPAPRKNISKVTAPTLVAPTRQQTPARQPLRVEEKSVNKPNAKLTDNLEQARQLADAGRFDEAAEICQAHLRSSKDSAQAFYLLGLVRDAAGSSEEAMEHYRKAIYLKPDHYDALMNLAYLTEKAGNKTGAQALRNRAQRVKNKGAT